MTVEERQRVERLTLHALVGADDNGDTPLSTRAMRACVRARGRHVDQALCALESESLAVRTPDGWVPGSMARTRLGHANGRRVRPSGAQVSYRKAVELVAANLAVWLPTYVDPKEEAEQILRGALSDRQRARLDARS